MRKTRFFKWLPTPQSIKQNRFLKPFGHHLHHHSLWQLNRASVAGGVAVGLFFGIMLPIAQVVFAALAAVLLRVNLPVAALSTLVTNPLTFPAIYYGAYKLGAALTGWVGPAQRDFPAPNETAQILAQQSNVGKWLTVLVDWAQSVGLPLITGLLVLAVTAAVCGYFLIDVLWRAHVLRRWRKRHRAPLVRDPGA